VSANSQGEDAAKPKADSTTARIVAVLDALARGPEGGVGVRQLAAELSVSRSAVHRMLQNLAELGIARPVRSGGYEAGATMVAWGAFLASRHSLFSAAQHLMDRVVEAANETTYLFTYEASRKSLTVIDSRQSTESVRYVLEHGSSSPIHVGASGKSVLALLPDSEIDDLALDMDASEAERFRQALREDLAETRKRGYAVSFGERIPDACGVASAFLVDGSPQGAIAINAPTFRMRESLVEPFGALVSAAARDLSALLDASSHSP
jgi:DNA-binding IclR family transcriptional regulator